jgi:hypothetical protein
MLLRRRVVDACFSIKLGILGFLYGDDLPHAYQRTVFGSIDAKRVNNSFLSWWRQTQHERYYAANPSQRPGATPVAASSAAATAGKDAKAGGKLQAKH